MGPFPVVGALKSVENHKASLRCKYRAQGWANNSDHYLSRASFPQGFWLVDPKEAKSQVPSLNTRYEVLRAFWPRHIKCHLACDHDKLYVPGNRAQDPRLARVRILTPKYNGCVSLS